MKKGIKFCRRMRGMHSTAAVIPKSTPECIDSSYSLSKNGMHRRRYAKRAHVFVSHEDKTRGHFQTFAFFAAWRFIIFRDNSC